MIVSELIAELQKMPQDAKVIIVKNSSTKTWDQEVRDVIYNDPSKLKQGHKDAGTVELDNWPAVGFLSNWDRNGE